MTKEERLEKQKEKLSQMKAFDAGFADFGIIAGMDEVGRGPLAGPVVTACVVLPSDFDVLGIDDSKKLSEKKRSELAPIIKEKALAYGFGMASQQVIDEINILQATKQAMKIAATQANSMLIERTGKSIGCVIIDAVNVEGLGLKQSPVIGGDAKSLSVAAASIMAKVTRDCMMIKYSSEYPGYGFEKNKGYGTRQHCDAIRKIGPCELHRKSFITNIVREVNDENK